MFNMKNIRRLASIVRNLAALGLAAAALTTGRAAPIDLADQPLFSTTGVPGNVLLALSVEWPTASTPAYLSTTAYSAASTYVGYFDAAKCYVYTNYATPSNGYFTPESAASSHACTSTASVARWSGNYLNWASTQTIDAFRWALTGGDRVTDTTSLTIIEKARHSGQGDRSWIYPDKVLSGGSGATPFNWGMVVSRVHGLGTTLYFSGGQELGCWFATNASRSTSITCDATSVAGGWLTIATSNNSPAIGSSTTVTGALSGSAGTLSCTVSRPVDNSYAYSCSTSLSGSTACTAASAYSASAAFGYCNTATTVTGYTGQSSAASTASATAFYQVNARVRVCDPTAGLEPNCVQYGSNYKPQGLVQQYATKLRFSAFGYLNDSASPPSRDGGVMRARMKYVGPTTPVPGSPSVTNGNAEWDATTGIMSTNPDAADATATSNDSTTAGYTVTITNSGVMNYLNRFGKVVTGNYKSYDPVGEMYYAGQRYFRNKGNVASYSSLAGAGSTATMTTWLDGFPAIKTWDDPILYSCQKNFILGIGDVNTWDDRNVPGTATGSGNEPAVPPEVTADTAVNATTSTNMVGQLEGLSNLASYSSGRNNSYYMAGLAYDAHTTDIRSDLSGTQTISTYWLDVMEGQTYLSKNQYWLAAKYGGFAVPTSGFSPYAGGNSSSTLADATWWTSGEMTPGGGDKRPDNYFLANQADKMVDGLNKAFAKIVSENDGATTTAFSIPTAKISTTGSASYAASFEPKTWSGIVTGSNLTFDTAGLPVVTPKWDARALLDATAATNRKIVTCCIDVTGAALPFRSTNLGSATLNARTNYASFASVPGVAAGSQSAANFVDYLRGDQTKEQSNSGVYRTRVHLLGDVSGSKANPVGPPNAPYFDLANPGYSAYKRAQRGRTTVVYVGANDGMMHAFDGTLPGSTTCSTCGTELFAYVPSFAYQGSDGSASSSGLASYGNPSFTHHFFVDATPLNFDIDFKNTVGSTATLPDWRTVLIGGLGKGGKGYYAIDVSNPTTWTDESAVASKVLWEFTDSRMGSSYGDASVVKTAKYGWVVIFTSGYNNSDGKGYFFIVNPRTGVLIEAIATSDGSTTSPLNMAHHTAYVPDYTNFTADSVYAGDLLGNVWRLDLTGSPATYPTPTKIATLADGSSSPKPQPVTTRPLIEVDPNSKKRYVLIGTGRLLADSDVSSTQRQAFYAIIDGVGTAGNFYKTATLPSGVTFPITRSVLNANTDTLAGIGAAPPNPMGWYVDLGPTDGTVAERINVNPVANVGVVLAGINRPLGTACEPGGTNRALGVSFSTGKTVLVDSSNAYIAQTPSSAGLIQDIGLFDVGGKVTGLVGDNKGALTPARLGGAAGLSLKRLNWREVPTID